MGYPFFSKNIDIFGFLDNEKSVKRGLGEGFCLSSATPMLNTNNSLNELHGQLVAQKTLMDILFWFHIIMNRYQSFDQSL